MAKLYHYQTPDDIQHVRYYAQQMEEGYGFMEKMMQYPVQECGETLESLPDAARAGGVDVEFSTTKIVNNTDRIFRLRTGLIEDFITIARAMNDRGWVQQEIGKALERIRKSSV